MRAESTGGVTLTKKSFTGQYRGDTGLLFYNARYYDPGTGRFVSADSLITNPQNPQTINRYCYTVNNPLRFVDPSGHCHYDAKGNIDKWDCTIKEFDAMTMQERTHWVEQFMKQSGCSCFHNILGVLDFFQAKNLGAPGTWISLVDAGILQGISLGYGNYKAGANSALRMKNSNFGADDWTAFFDYRATNPLNLEYQAQLWGRAEQHSTNYGRWYAENGTNPRTGQAYGLKPHVKELGLISATDVYRGIVQYPGGANISLFDPFNRALRGIVRQMAVGYWDLLTSQGL